MKKFVTLFVAMVISVICVAGLAGCSGYSETFTGKISDESYTTSEEAVKAFLDNEVSGISTTAEYVSYEKEGDLSSKDLEKLGLEESILSSITSAEKGTVTYIDAGSSAYAEGIALADDAVTSLTYTQGVYVFQIGSSYRYFVPALSNGEKLTKSYYESVFEIEKYKNCTLAYNMTVAATATEGSSSVQMNMDISYNVKYTESAIYLEMTYSASESYNSQTFSDSETISAYFATVNDTFVCAVNYDGTWTAIPASYLGLGLSSVDDIYTLAENNLIDYTYFEKTDTGFALRSDKYAQYLQETFDGVIDEDMLEYPGTAFSAEATYFVKEGRLAKSTSAASVNYTEGTATAVASASMECLYSDFGSTVVELPEEVQALFTPAA